MSDLQRIAATRQEEHFRALVRDSVTGSIRDVLGETAMRALIFYVPPELLVFSPQEYREKLREVVKGGASILEYLILRDLSELSGIHLGNEESDLRVFMERVRAAILSGQARDLREGSGNE